MKATRILCSALALMAAAAYAQINVYVDGKRVNFSGTEPRMVGSRVMVPLRGVFEELGASVRWDGSTNTVYASRNNTNVQLRIGDTTAMVDGRSVMMDVPAQLVAGRTMVPLRFVSEALGAEVHWDAANEAVRIDSGMNTEISTGRGGVGTANPLTLQQFTVIPVVLQNSLSSNNSSRGDQFTAKVKSSGDAAYLGLPIGTTIEGRVSVAQKRDGNNPGVLGLTFDRLRLPDGRTFALSGTLIGLDNASVETTSEGRIVAKPDKRDDTLTYVGIGAGLGTIFAIITDRGVLNDAIIGAALGYLYSRLQDRSNVRDVQLPVGTEVGVRLDDPLTVRL